MKRDKTITLLKSLSKNGYHKDIISSRTKQIKTRLNVSGNLGFRMHNHIIKKHGNILDKLRPYYDTYAKCLVCNNTLYQCICKIEVRDREGNLIKEM